MFTIIFLIGLAIIVFGPLAVPLVAESRGIKTGCQGVFSRGPWKIDQSN